MSITIGWDFFKLLMFFPGHISYGCGTAACHFEIELLGFFFHLHVLYKPSAWDTGVIEKDIERQGREMAEQDGRKWP